MKLFCLNNISKIALSSVKGKDEIVNNENDADAIIVRSFNMHEYNLPSSILAITRAGSGVNNIPCDKYSEKGVVVFNTPGSNANAVKELLICSLLLSSRGIIDGVNWIKDNKDDKDIKKTTEKIKANFSGNELYSKTIAVLGLGKIGILVANSLMQLGLKVIGYDPYLTLKGATQLDRHIVYAENLLNAIKDADYVTIHIPLLDSTKNLLSKDEFQNMKDGVVLINLSRDEIVDEDLLKEYLDNGKVKKYVTDFPNTKVVNFKNTIVIPHLGASTLEAEDNSALMAIDEVKDYLENGNITNSVNYPSINAQVKTTKYRLSILHKNVPGMIVKFSSIFSSDNKNISNLLNKSKGEYAVTIIDYDEEIDVNLIKNTDGVLRVRVI